MKKITCVLILATIASLSFSGCTEQEVKPKANTATIVSDPIK
jgi:hypothetical protein